MEKDMMKEIIAIKNSILEINEKLSQICIEEQKEELKYVYPLIYKMQCKYCGKEYMSSTKAKRFCKEECKKQYQKLKRQEYYKKRKQTLTEEEKKKMAEEVKNRMRELRELRSSAISQIIKGEHERNVNI